MLILMNDCWIEKSKARIELFSDAVMYGFGLFETFRTFEKGTLFRLDYHIERLLTAADRIGLKVIYSRGEISDMVARVVAKSGLEFQRLKIQAFSECLVVSSDRLARDDSLLEGVDLFPLHMQRALPDLKTTSYLDCLQSYERARSAGFYDALLLDDSGHVTEGSRCNVFWVAGDTVMTREKKVLPGITRRVVIEELPVKTVFSKINRESLSQVDEMFITNSIIGVVPVTRIGDIPVKDGEVGPLTLSVISQYHQLLQDTVDGS